MSIVDVYLLSKYQAKNDIAHAAAICGLRSQWLHADLARLERLGEPSS